MTPGALLDLCAKVTTNAFMPFVILASVTNLLLPFWKFPILALAATLLYVCFFCFVFLTWLFSSERFLLIAHHPFIFASLMGIPLVVLTWVLQKIASGKLGGPNIQASCAPDWIWQLHSASTPLLAAVIGFIVAVCLASLADQHFSVAISTLARKYSFWFVLFWCPIFWFLNFFYLGMWGEAGVGAARSGNHWFRDFLVRGIVEQYPSIFSPTFAVAFVLVGVAMLVGETRKV